MRLRSAAAAVGIVALFASMSAAVAVPWRDVGDSAGELGITRYLSYEDGASQLVRRDVPDRRGEQWVSRTVEVLPGLRALSDLPGGLSSSLAEHIAGEGAGIGDALGHRDQLVDARVMVLSSRRLEGDGSTSTDLEAMVLDADGLFTLGFVSATDGSVTTVDPPLRLLPADATVGTSWDDDGTIGASPFTFAGRITDHGPFETELGELDDCIEVTSTFTVGEDPARTDDFVDWYCAGIGWSTGSVDGEDPATYVTVSAGERTPAELPPATRPARSRTPVGLEEGDWSMARVGSALPASTSGGMTFAPVWIPSDPPQLLAATDAGGDLVALAASGVLGAEQWRVPTAGAIYSAPRHDPGRGRLYFGASDGRVRAFDERGLFLWSVSTGDNVPGTPALAGDKVVVGSEDGTIRAIDADHGEVAWTATATGAVIASPATAGDLVVIADDAGNVMALESDDGDVAWTHTVGGAVDAPVVEVDGDVLIADRLGGLTRIDAGGDEVWTVDAGDQMPVRAAPTVVGDHVLVVNSIGEIASLGLADGERRWRDDAAEHVGSGVEVGEAVAVATADGGVRVLDPADGRQLARYESADAVVPTDRPPSLRYGLTVGGGALWLGDEQGIARRLGPRDDAASRSLRPAWITPTISEPFAGFPVVASPVPWGEHVVVVDGGGNLHLLDATTGVAGPPVAITDPGDSFVLEPIVSGDLLIADVGPRLIAVSLPNGELQWSHPLAGQRLQPPALAGGVIVALVSDGGDARIEAVDVATGVVRWSVTTGARALSSGVAVSGDLVIAGDPTVGIDAETGEVVWRSDVGAASGAPVVLEDGDIVVATFRDGDESGGLARIDAETGVVAWAVATAGHALAPNAGLLALDGLVGLPSAAGPILGIDPANGSERWSTQVPGTLLGAPAAIDGSAWIALETGQVVVLDASGASVASFEGFGGGIGATGLLQRPVDVGGSVVVTAGSVVFAIAKASP